LQLARRQLYDLVWANPVKRVAEALGISDVMLAKIFRQKDVPRPPRGAGLSASSRGHEQVSAGNFGGVRKIQTLDPR